jgi:DNA-binding ferritin-like protein (Dps family)
MSLAIDFKMKKQPKTFAERAKAIQKRYPRSEWDAIERKDMLKELRALKDEQEQVRSLMEIADNAGKMDAQGVAMPRLPRDEQFTEMGQNDQRFSKWAQDVPGRPQGFDINPEMLDMPGSAQKGGLRAAPVQMYGGGYPEEPTGYGLPGGKLRTDWTGFGTGFMDRTNQMKSIYQGMQNQNTIPGTSIPSLIQNSPAQRQQPAKPGDGSFSVNQMTHPVLTGGATVTPQTQVPGSPLQQRQQYSQGNPYNNFIAGNSTQKPWWMDTQMSAGNWYDNYLKQAGASFNPYRGIKPFDILDEPGLRAPEGYGQSGVKGAQKGGQGGARSTGTGSSGGNGMPSKQASGYTPSPDDFNRSEDAFQNPTVQQDIPWGSIGQMGMQAANQFKTVPMGNTGNGIAKAAEFGVPGVSPLPFAISAGASLLGDLANRHFINKMDDRVNLGRVTAQNVDMEPERQALTRNNDMTRNAMLKAGRDMGPAQGYANMAAMNTGLMDSYGTAMGKSYMNEQNINAGYRQQANMQNAQIAQDEAKTNLGLRLQKLQAKGANTESMFNTIPQAMKDYTQAVKDQDTTNMLGKDYGIYAKVLGPDASWQDKMRQAFNAQRRYIKPRESVKP